MAHLRGGKIVVLKMCSTSGSFFWCCLAYGVGSNTHDEKICIIPPTHPLYPISVFYFQPVSQELPNTKYIQTSWTTYCLCSLGAPRRIEWLPLPLPPLLPNSWTEYPLLNASPRQHAYTWRCLNKVRRFPLQMDEVNRAIERWHPK